MQRLQLFILELRKRLEAWRTKYASQLLGSAIKTQRESDDPVSLAEKNIRELKNDLSESLRGLAEVKATYIRSKREREAQLKLANDYEKKAVLLLERARDGSLSEQEADRLAAHALLKKEEITRRAQAGEKNINNYETLVAQLEENTMKLKAQIDAWENEIKSLKARAQVSAATKNLHDKLSKLNQSSSGLSLNELQEQIANREAMAESLNYVHSGRTSVDDEINRILGLDPRQQASNELNRLKTDIKNTSAPVSTTTNTPSESLLSELERLKNQLKDKE